MASILDHKVVDEARRREAKTLKKNHKCLWAPHELGLKDWFGLFQAELKVILLKPTAISSQ